MGKNGMHPRTRNILHNLKLRRIFDGVFMKASPGTLIMLQRVEPFITYGYPNPKNVSELIYKKGHGKINNQKVPLIDNKIIEQALGMHNIVCLEDIIHQVTTVGPHIKEVTSFLGAFALNKPREGLHGKKYRGDTRNREDLINNAISKINFFNDLEAYTYSISLARKKEEAFIAKKGLSHS